MAILDIISDVYFEKDQRIDEPTVELIRKIFDNVAQRFINP